MNNTLLNTFFRFIISSLALTGCAIATPLNPDLNKLSIDNGWKGHLSATKVIKKADEAAVEFNKPGQNVVWLDGFEFKEGIIEFDAKGKSSPPQGSFIGVAFRVMNEETHDAVYFRAFNFQSTDPERKTHAVQYVSEPKWPWHKLRKNKTGQYEKAIEPAPDGDDWFHVKLILENRQVKVFVNGETEPSLHVNELSDRQGGSVGLWSNEYGVIANLQITPAK